jgi:uncharacterized membrane protein
VRLAAVAPVRFDGANVKWVRLAMQFGGPRQAGASNASRAATDADVAVPSPGLAPHHADLRRRDRVYMRPAAGRMRLMVRTALRWLAAVAFVGAGLNHFRSMPFYERIVPPSFPRPRLLVVVSGVAEVLGGLGLLVRPLRRAAGWGLIALLLAVLPANVHMATSDDPRVTLDLPRWALILRLPLQAVLIVWVAWVSRPSVRRSGSAV